ncbi:MAG TPA: hypothetical protein VLS90_17440, partial [Thermodesulfobacteriota bacterium]|nr:hypothetical protein [Thermodesulfobacteriota bacterium]
VDEWLLRGCPAKKTGNSWEFDVEKVQAWLKTKKIRTGEKPKAARSTFDDRWLTGRCPVCADRGFSGSKAGRVYTLGEISQGEWNLRRTGIPCGHSAYIPAPVGSESALKRNPGLK